ncbi:MAG: hypothetical protein M1825_005165 [Sarcosagium campestre]|nr:MAG: hypothetical protein M1825_005165 [Sarcosagium campestre]
MRAAPQVINWHNDNSPIYSAHFEPHGKGRLATGGGDNNVRLWRLEPSGEDRRIVYLTTLIKHTQAVNVVRFCPRGEMLATAGDDGNVLLWVPSEAQGHTPSFGDDASEDKETWRIKHMCRSSGSEIYDLAWSPDGVFFITGSLDNIARIYNAQTGQIVRQIAEHNHYVQGVAWDPLNEFVATQSSDRSVHIYTLKTKDGQFSLAQHGKITKMDLPPRRTSSNSPAPPDFGPRPHFITDTSALTIASPAPSAPGTPTSLPLPMNPPAMTPSRRSSFGSSPSFRRSPSPAPSLPLPAVRPMESSPKVSHGMGVRNANIYANETFTSFFRRLCFTPDGSLLFTPAGQYKTSHAPSSDSAKPSEDVTNTVYIYTRAGFNKPPIAHLPGHKKPSIAVKCSPIFYNHRKPAQTTKHITVDTSSGDGLLQSLPEPAITSRAPSTSSMMEPPPPLDVTSQLSASESSSSTLSRRESESSSSAFGPIPAFALPYRMVYAVATQDAVLVYDTQQQTPLCVVSNLHFATFTDLTWSADGLTLLMSSSDGFCSTLTFNPGELGQVYSGAVPTLHHPSLAATVSSSSHSTPAPTPTSASTPAITKPSPQNVTGAATSSPAPPVRPTSPTRSNSTSSVATQASLAHSQAAGVVVTNPIPTLGSVPSVGAATPGAMSNLSTSSPPQTPMSGTMSTASSVSGASVLGKREPGGSESDLEDGKEATKKRRIAPTLVSVEGQGGR